jgi:alpha-L-fucosidase
MFASLRPIALILLLAACSPPPAAEYGPNWESLSAHDAAPDWFRNAKFGIYFHWGPYSVPAYGNEHYPRTMYGHPSGKKPVESETKYNPAIGFQSYREHEFHKENFGEPGEFEYHDLVPLFEAHDFNADEWAELFYLAGAKFAGPVAEHHDGYAMWDSEWTPWNAADTGPRRDVVGEIAAAVRKRGMKVITTFHHAKNGRPAEGEAPRRWWHYFGREQYFSRFDPEHADSRELQKLYGSMRRDAWLEMWNGKLEEVIDRYRPDIIWFDSWLDRIPERNRAGFAAYYLNAAQEWDKDVVITYKQEDLPQSVGVVDFEKGRLDELTPYAWLTDDTISAGPWTTTGSWSYTGELDIRSGRELLHTLIDIVSKNGQLLLNISPRADGTIPDDQRTSLLEMGDWLRVNGEAIYGTRPFVVYGEGPKRLRSSGHFVSMAGAYDAENIRYTTDGNTVYAIQLGWPGSNAETLLHAFAPMGQLEVSSVAVVGSPEEIEWQLASEGLSVVSPAAAPNTVAICYRIETNGMFATTTGQQVRTVAVRALSET